MISSTHHPDHATWERLATGELAAGDRAACLSHIVGCARCARTWRALRFIAREAASFDPDVPAEAAAETPIDEDVTSQPVVPARRQTRLRPALLLGGGIALAAAVALLIWMPGTEHRGGETVDHGALRGGDGARVELLAPAPGELDLGWRAFPGAEHYVVEVFTRDGRPAWRRDAVTTTTLRVESGLAPGAYRWQVEAWASGRRLAVSVPAHLTIAP